VRRGAVQGRGEPLNVRVCHCRNCQKAMGSPFFARALFPHARCRSKAKRALPLVGALTGCSARPAAAGCLRGGRAGVAGVALAAFDDRNAFAPTEHIWVSEKMRWVKLDDGLPQYRERFRCDMKRSFPRTPGRRKRRALRNP